MDMIPIAFGHHRLRVSVQRVFELAIALAAFAFVLLAVCSPAH